MPPPADKANPTRIVILGGGFAGAYCAQALDRGARKLNADLLLIDARNYFIFFPLLVEAGTGNLEPRHAVVSIRQFLGKQGRFMMAKATAVDLDRRVITCAMPDGSESREVPYDHLVLALGSITNLAPIPGIERVFQVKNMSDAIGLRDHAINMLEMADAAPTREAAREYLHFVVVGGNFSGVEVAGEFDVFLREATREYTNLSPADVKVTIVDRSPQILTALEDDDLSNYAAAHLKKRGLEILLKTSVNEVQADYAVLSTGEKIPTRTVIWNAGIAVNPLIRTLGLPLDPRGYLLCERDLRAQGRENVWAIGDCAVNIDAEGKPYPATAQLAIRQGAHLAKNLILAIQGKPALPCDLKSVGGLASLGCRTGVAKIFGIKVSGILAWFLWRTVYLMKMPGWGRRVRIALDWTVDLFFRADYVQMGIHHRAEPKKPAPAPDAVKSDAAK